MSISAWLSLILRSDAKPPLAVGISRDTGADVGIDRLRGLNRRGLCGHWPGIGNGHVISHDTAAKVALRLPISAEAGHIRLSGERPAKSRRCRRGSGPTFQACPSRTPRYSDRDTNCGW